MPADPPACDRHPLPKYLLLNQTGATMASAFMRLCNDVLAYPRQYASYAVYSLSIILAGVNELPPVGSIRQYRILQSHFVIPFGHSLRFATGHRIPQGELACGLLAVRALIPPAEDFIHYFFIFQRNS